MCYSRLRYSNEESGIRDQRSQFVSHFRSFRVSESMSVSDLSKVIQVWQDLGIKIVLPLACGLMKLNKVFLIGPIIRKKRSMNIHDITLL